MIKPIGNRVLLKLLSTQEISQNGIIIVETSKNNYQTAEIIATNNTPTTNYSFIKGDTVLIPKFSGTEITYNNEQYLIIQEDELLGVITK